MAKAKHLRGLSSLFDTTARLYGRLPDSITADPPDDQPQQRLDRWQRFIDLREFLIDSIRADDDFTSAARREIQRVDVAIADGRDRALQGVLNRIRNFRLVRALMSVEQLIESSRGGPALSAADFKIKLQYVSSCLLSEPGDARLRRYLRHPDVDLCRKMKGLREAAVMVLDKLAPTSARTIYRALKSARKEFGTS